VQQPIPTSQSRTAEDYRRAWQASEARCRNLIEKNADGVIVISGGGLIRFANPAAATLLGRPVEALLGQPFGVPVIPGETTEIDLVRGGVGNRVAEMRLVEIDWEGEAAFVASLREVSERKRAEDTLRILAEASAVLVRTLDQPTTLVNLSRLAVAYLADWCLIDVVDADGALRRAAVAHREPTLHAQAQRLRGHRFLDRQAPHGPPRVLRARAAEIHPEADADFLAGLATDADEASLLGTFGCRSALLVPLTARDQALGVITFGAAEPGRRYGEPERHLAEELARRAALALDNARLYDESQEAVRRRDEFLAMLGHELRNPLGSILNAVAVLRVRSPADPVAREVAGVIERQGRHMARLLDELLDTSRITQGKIDLRPEPLDLAGVLRDAVEGNRPVLEARRHALALELPAEPLGVVGDPTRLEQVFGNLLNNAAKYTDPGGHIRVCAGREGAEVVVRVRDDGLGIAPDVLPRVFDLFTQAAQSLDRTQGGLGVGLTLVRRLVEMHGGRVEAHSDGPGRGSEFVVRLPAAPAPQPRPLPPPRKPPGGAPRRILLVEDNPDIRDMLAQLLQLGGHSVEVASDGPQGIARALADRPDLALIDIGLPGLDGYEVARRLRAALDGRPLRLIALTGYDQPEDRRRAFDAGFDAYLIKPVDLAKLERLLRQDSP
jgi:signal transduction histidine kinase/CheY-like chemotaxis protein